MKKFLLTALFVGLSSQVNAASVDLVVNGSFENPNIQAGSWRVFGAIPGWSTTGAGVEIRDNVAGTAYHGDQFAELDSYSNSSIYQTLDTTINQEYTLSFAYSPRIRQAESTNGISVSWNGVELSTISAQGGRANNWTIYNFTVLGSGSDILSFASVGRNDSLGGNVDAISVIGNLGSELSSVPVPAAMFLFAPALLGFMGIRRAKKTTV